ncbi:MAG: hypothetical protein KatS3mg076_2187 [Candidatus Binatia bacterium]|nr:MAG: hypothetical protein KatS3mg076_2187 [Candidatus Binatia bacterium]
MRVGVFVGVGVRVGVGVGVKVGVGVGVGVKVGVSVGVGVGVGVGVSVGVGVAVGVGVKVGVDVGVGVSVGVGVWKSWFACAPSVLCTMPLALTLKPAADTPKAEAPSCVPTKTMISQSGPVVHAPSSKNPSGVVWLAGLPT